MQDFIPNLGITLKTTRFEILSNRHYNHLKEWDNIVFKFICDYLKKHGFFEWSEWCQLTQQGSGDIFRIESLLPRPGAHIPLPKLVKSELESSRCPGCRKAVCESNCEQLIEDYNQKDYGYRAFNNFCRELQNSPVYRLGHNPTRQMEHAVHPLATTTRCECGQALFLQRATPDVAYRRLGCMESKNRLIELTSMDAIGL